MTFSLQKQLCRTLKACIANADLSKAQALHALYVKAPTDTYLSNHFVLLYSRCGLLSRARRLFDEIPNPNVFSYNALLHAYVKASHFDLARDLFARIPNPDLVSYNTLLAAHASRGDASEALRTLSEMRAVGLDLDGFTLSSAVASASSAHWVVEQLHSLAISGGFDAYASVANALVSSYSKVGSLKHAARAFDEMGGLRDGVSWNCMTVAYAQHRMGPEALVSLKEMVRGGFEVEVFTFASVLTAFAGAGDLLGGTPIHAWSIKCAFERNPNVGSGLVDLYSKCGRVSESEKAFEDVPEPDLVLWNTMITGYSQNEECFEHALRCFRELQRAGLRPDDCSFVCSISVCSNLSSPLQGKQMHSLVLKSEIPVNRVTVDNALVTMYAKCGNLEDARRLFERMTHRNTVSFNSMIAAYAQHGYCFEALSVFERLLTSENTPTAITFVSVLSACAHGGKLDEGRMYFRSMKDRYGIEPEAEHYSCMIDLLGRAGQFEEAEALIRSMSFDLDAVGWSSLLGACRTHHNFTLGVRAADRLIQMDPSNCSAYVMLVNMHSSMGQWKDVAEVRRLMRDRGVRKRPGYSWIELKKEVHVFVAGDSVHPKIREIHTFLEEMMAGYVPDMRWAVAREGEEDGGEMRLGHHSEKLAVGFGLMSTGDGVPILVVKNLRICGDCHSAMKYMSAVAGREITVRDAHRFHCFRDGKCSCGDYW
ncbi:Pentatricopeptide repeat-containing protein [Acorus calamus]|uniref:Pentatricopeptide repeat-containing protein n=1 Tax=Acorus calamus TaxID=4465 RepID=A0AAV9FFA1_ACOCL|nr:Pentatricopeptide repeat-containing protein [Acorus calamus]